jgi:hypothetical protein
MYLSKDEAIKYLDIQFRRLRNAYQYYGITIDVSQMEDEDYDGWMINDDLSISVCSVDSLTNKENYRAYKYVFILSKWKHYPLPDGSDIVKEDIYTSAHRVIVALNRAIFYKITDHIDLELRLGNCDTDADNNIEGVPGLPIKQFSS